MGNSERYALIIGISAYGDGERITELPYAKMDALRLRDVLLQNGAFEPNHVYLLANGFEDNEPDGIRPPTRPEILQVTNHVLQSARHEDLVLLFFAGHGVEVSQTPYLITADTKMEVVKETAIKIADLNAKFEESKAGFILRLFDACRRPFAQARGVMETMSRGLEEAILKTAKGWASFSSCSSGEMAHESNEFEQGVFSYYVCEGLQGKAVNDNSRVTLERLVDYVKTSVDNWCDRQTLSQTPHFQSDLSGPIVLTTLPRVPQVASHSPADPIAAYKNMVELHLQRAPADAQQLRETTEEERREAYELIHGVIEESLQLVAHPRIEVLLRGPLRISKFVPAVREALHADLARVGLGELCMEPPVCTRVHLSSSTAVLPSTRVFFVLQRFGFYYWLWYCYQCDVTPNYKGFQPDPLLATGWFTFAPGAVKDPSKIQGAVREVFSRMIPISEAWAGQLTNYIEAQVKPLRDLGTIVE
ncbi:MAG: caspase family protein [Phycisphaerae bacterium]|nr:caspase family protein [Phycisphaerae bacterium]